MSRKLFLEPKLAMTRKWQKSVIFEWNFDLFLSFFMDSGHIYVPSSIFRDFSSIVGHTEETWWWTFFYFAVHLQWSGSAQKRQILDRKWPNITSFSTFQCGSKKSKMANLTMKLWKMSEKGQNSIKNRTLFPSFLAMDGNSCIRKNSSTHI